MPKVKLSEIGTLSRGKSKHRPRNDKILYGGAYPFVQTSDIKNANHVLQTYEQTYNEIGLKQSKLWQKNTICITIAANIADSAILGFDACFPDSVLGLIVNEKIANYHYVEYLLQYYKRILQKQSNGTSQENINLETFEKVLFDIPPLLKQKAISETLYAIDKKIELNNKVNMELESVAKDVYNYWFVQFDFPDEFRRPYKSSGGKMVYNDVLKREIPEGWEVKNLLDIVEWISGAQPPKATFIYQPQNGYVRFIQNRDYAGDTNVTYIKESKNNKVCDVFDIMMDKYGDAGRVRYGLAGAYNVALSKIKVNVRYGQEYIRKFLESDSVYNYLYNACMASTRASLNGEILGNLNIAIPNDTLLKNFEMQNKQIINQILQNKQENEILSNLRDFLLPMLMNGQVSD